MKKINVYIMYACAVIWAGATVFFSLTHNTTELYYSALLSANSVWIAALLKKVAKCEIKS